MKEKYGIQSVKSAFSLMEMMIVLLIVSIIAAATAPIVSRKMSQSAGSGDSPWVFTNTRGSIAYNMSGNNDMQAIIGANRYTRGENGPTSPRLVLSGNGNDAPALVFAEGVTGRYRGTINMTENTVTMNGSNGQVGTFSVAMGMGQTHNGSVGTIAIGQGANVSAVEGCAVGRNATVTDVSSTAIGRNSVARAPISTAIGGATVFSGSPNAVAVGINARVGTNGGGGNLSSVAVGSGAFANNQRVAALGADSIATGSHAVAVGSYAHASGIASIAIGSNTANESDNARPRAQGNFSIAIGSSSLAENANGIAIGNGATATSGISIGQNAESVSTGISIGSNHPSSMINGIAIGNTAIAQNIGDIAIGVNTTTAGDYYTGWGAINIGGKIKYSGFDIGGAFSTGGNVNGRMTLGDANTLVHIPGYLVVDGTVVLGGQTLHNNFDGVYIREWADKGWTWRVHDVDDEDDELQGFGPGIGTYGSNIGNVTSDRRLKDIGKKYEAGLAELKKIDLYNFTFKNDKHKTPQVGVIAQDLQKVFPDSVATDTYGYLRIRWDEMFYAVINAVKELDARITALAEQVKANLDKTAVLEATIQEQQKTIDELKAQNVEFEKRLAKLEKKSK